MNKRTAEERMIRDSFLSKYLADEGITDISFNGSCLNLQHNRKGRFKAEEQLSEEDAFQFVKKIADLQGKDFTFSNPILDTELGYLRVNAVHDSIAESGVTFSIRHSPPKLAIKDLREVTTTEVARLLRVLIHAKSNIVISGATGSGKTEVQKTLVGFIPNHHKITLVEDTRDSHLKILYPEKDINSWRTLKDYQREQQITEHELIKAGLRNSPEWIIVSETRGPEAYDMLDSALTGHSILTTIHANNAMQIPSRLIRMICKSYPVNEILLGKDITQVLKFGVHMHLEHTDTGIRRFIREIVEFTGFNKDGAKAQTIYRTGKIFNQETMQYEIRNETGQLSVETVELLTDRSLLHETPEIFIKK